MRKHCRRQRDAPHLQSLSSQRREAQSGSAAGKSKARKTKKFLTFEQKVEVLDITPGEAASEEAMDAIRVWATVEDEEDVAEAMRADAAEEITARLAGTHVDANSKEEKEEEEDDDDESTEPGRGAPFAYAELSPHFGVLERAAEECGNKDAAFYLSKARMSMIAAHSAKRTCQTDLREFVSAEVGETE